MRPLILIFLMSVAGYSQTPPIEPGVSQELARWRAGHYSDVRYKLNLTLEKMSPVLKGTIEVRVVLRDAASEGRREAVIVLDWRKIRGHEEKSTISNVSINGTPVRSASFSLSRDEARTPSFEESNEHLVFRDGVVAGENVIKLDFTSPILPSGSAITRYIDKEDGSEYIYSLFVPSDASTAFPVFDQPDLKARVSLFAFVPEGWTVVSNTPGKYIDDTVFKNTTSKRWNGYKFDETKPISTYVFAFAAGPWEKVSGSYLERSQHRSELRAVATGSPDCGSGIADCGLADTPNSNPRSTLPSPQSGRPVATAQGSDLSNHIFVRRSQLSKFQPHAAEVFRLNHEAIKYFEEYFDYKFPFPKYDIVLIPEFPFGGMEHAGATFLREAAIIFPSEPTKNDIASRATLIFHEAAHQWFGDTVTMRWFDDLWLKEGFANFTAYKAMEKIMPEMNAWKIFYERIKQGAYQTDSTRGTTAIYQPIPNLSAAKSAYGNIVYNKAPAFLRQAEFYLGEDKFRAAVRAFLKKHEFGNATWEDLVKDFEVASKLDLKEWADLWVTRRGLSRVESCDYNIFLKPQDTFHSSCISQRNILSEGTVWPTKVRVLYRYADGTNEASEIQFSARHQLGNEDANFIRTPVKLRGETKDLPIFIYLNYQDYGYGIFLVDDKSRDYILKNIQNEADPFLRSMMWGALWDSVREGELDPKEYVELAVKNIGSEKDEMIVQATLGRVLTAMTYYISEPPAVVRVSPHSVESTRGNPVATAPGSDLRGRLEQLLMERMRNAPTLGQRITYYRALLNVASTDNGRNALKELLRHRSEPGAVATGSPDYGSSIADCGLAVTKSPNPQSAIRNPKSLDTLPTGRVSASSEALPLKTKDRFDIVTKLASLGDPDAETLLKELEKTETSDDAKRYAYAARAAFPTKESKEKYWNDFVNNKEISESWIEAAFGPFNSVRHAELTLPYLERALTELPNHKRNRKIFFVNGWLAAFIGGQKSSEALEIVNKFLADNPNLDRDLRLKILENVDIIERAVKIRGKYGS